jgi:hypothetical protein
MKTNREYLLESINMVEKLDEKYMSLQLNPDLENYLEKTRQIKNVLTQLKDNYNDANLLEQLVALINHHCGGKNEFTSFINACDSSISSASRNLESLSKIVEFYHQYREFSEEASRIYIQAMLDKGSQRSLGSAGENKIIEIAEEYGFIHVYGIRDFTRNDYAVAKYSKSLKRDLIPDVNFGSQNKDLDIILKAGNKVFFIEAKHLKDGGGAQDKQIKELLGLIKNDLSEYNNDYYIVAYMDGVYSNTLLDITEPYFSNPELYSEEKQTKLITQKYELLMALNRNSNSLWLNTGSLRSLLEDLTND